MDLMQVTRLRVRFRTFAAVVATLVVFASSAHAQGWSVIGRTTTNKAEQVAGAAVVRESLYTGAAESHLVEREAMRRYLGEFASPALDTQPPWRAMLSHEPRLEALGDYAPSLMAESPLTSDVESFGNRFLRGAEDPDYLHRIRLSHPDVYGPWAAAPWDKRALFFGARKDEAFVESLSARLEGEFETFFYQDCLKRHGVLCPPEVIGAFARTTHFTIRVESPAALKSPFVNFEVSTARNLNPLPSLEEQFELHLLLEH